MLPSSEECAVDSFQLVAVRVAHGADADHTGQLCSEIVASEGGRRGHGPNICTPPGQQTPDWSHRSQCT